MSETITWNKWVETCVDLLRKETKELRAETQALRTELNDVRAKLDDLHSRMRALEAGGGTSAPPSHAPNHYFHPNHPPAWPVPAWNPTLTFKPSVIPQRHVVDGPGFPRVSPAYPSLQGTFLPNHIS